MTMIITTLASALIAASFAPTEMASQAVAGSKSRPSSISEHLLSEYRSVCNGTNPRGGLNRINDQDEDRDVRKRFGWTLVRMAVSLERGPEHVILTKEDRECFVTLIERLHQEDMLDGLAEQLDQDRLDNEQH
ncbi:MULTISPECIES: iron-containing alcohol dehydrogenase family protein [Brevundimonas]|jgi:hypothetical protein|uniref:Uncharacterized protein n=2 Tax=Brevundimonas TaxID=41275 RepID=A0ABU4KUJ2_BREVE|nr:MULTISPECIES: iron-containing alcohol dehydrogenase family protein [Brevundimonas]MDX2336534.1 hypothetical protein [Brevundimonas vesicularis]QIF81701.1 iron-containing alcohol dehydrogenase family protein [Brevundimonas sp. 'scallop']QSF53361.1 hypothetical protein JX001_11195 [Brevundimonas fontaquae]